MNSLLAGAFAPDPPGAALPPGPRTNDWSRAGAVPVEVPTRAGALLRELWGTRGHHITEAGGPTTVPRRLVPSAGGAYPVQWHVVVPGGAASELAPGRYVYHPASDRLLRRDGAAPPGGRPSLVITVQPGRTFGRYRHRAWPLWIADAAYALEAVRTLVPAAVLPEGWAGMGDARQLLELPPGHDVERWVRHGLVPEICLARVELPAGWAVDHRARDGLARRRSPALAAFRDAAARRARYGPPAPAAVETADEAARQSGQGWVLGADRVLLWPRPHPVDVAAAHRPLWEAHRAAARMCYRFARDGYGVRPVSGFVHRPGPGAPPLLHALAVLRTER
ncbi:hypothetical protein [Myceligenerans xiligouense]|uniref:Uncharacterized protein n=1 Tax=Myceligenerans xiligouense TaxID=253184 RepID=A0A3N4ZIB6_9MICO|nr:hypothetical protein [Myceligenerans xiligouense]RPF20615.1 hypothetical protein EDD34_1212 [Myceligenerans xiligouense]